MKKLFCTICDRCKKIIHGAPISTHKTKSGKTMHFCSNYCFNKFFNIKQ